MHQENEGTRHAGSCRNQFNHRTHPATLPYAASREPFKDVTRKNVFGTPGRRRNLAAPCDKLAAGLRSRAHSAGADLKAADLTRRVFLLLSSGAVSCCCLSRRCCFRSAREAENLAAHRCSHLLSRSRGILLITQKLRARDRPRSKASTRTSPERSRGAGAHVLAPIGLSSFDGRFEYGRMAGLNRAVVGAYSADVRAATNFHGSEKSRIWLGGRYSVARWRNGSNQGLYYGI
jgi:hypothetical protein